MPPDIAILGFDTSAAHCAAALLVGGRTVAAAEEDMARGQAERLVPMLQEMLAAGGLGWPDLAGFGVGTGPGNFTGIRISVAAARALALVTGKPAVGVSRFEAMAMGTSGPVLVALKAGRQGAYLQRLADGVPQGEPALALPEDLPHEPGLTVIGDAAQAVAAAVGGQMAEARLPMAEAIARIAAARLASGPKPAPPSPLYVRGPDADPPRDPPVILP